MKKDELPVLNIMAEVENVIEMQISPDNHSVARALAVQNISNAMKQNHKLNDTDKLLSIRTAYNDTDKFFRKHPELFIINSDKSKKTIIIHKDDYFAKDQLLSDRFLSVITSYPTFCSK
jgi:hypothetical protein